MMIAMRIIVSGVSLRLCVINKKGDMVYLIAQGFTPSQSIHIITNLENPSISPWYKLKINQNTLNTPRYIFKKPIICSFDKN